MSVSWLTLRDLEYIIAVADHAHFGKAAEACHVSQPSLSAQVRKVEDFLGQAVFERTKRRVAITGFGETVVAQARRVMAEARKLGELAQGSREPLSGPFRLGAIATLGPYLMPHLLGPLRKKYPKMELLLEDGLTDGLIAQLRSGKLDAVLASPTFSEEGLKLSPLFVEPFVLVAPKAHSIATKESVRAADFRANEMVLLEDGHCLKDQALGLCPVNRRGSLRRFHVTSLETLVQLVASGQGYTLIPKLAVREDAKLKELLTYRTLDDRRVGREIVLVCRQSYTQMEDIEQLAKLIRAVFPPNETVSCDRFY